MNNKSNVSRETSEMNEKYMNIAIKEAKKSYKKGEIPVGAVIIKNNKIISKAHNQKEKSKNVIKHAEIIAISKACKKIKNWRLENCEIYITMEPCMMCCGAIEQSRIKKIVYCVENHNFGYTKKIKEILENEKILVEKIEQENQIQNMLKEFFKKIR